MQVAWCLWIHDVETVKDPGKFLCLKGTTWCWITFSNICFSAAVLEHSFTIRSVICLELININCIRWGMDQSYSWSIYILYILYFFPLTYHLAVARLVLNSWAQVIFPSQPPEWLGLQMCHATWFYFSANYWKDYHFPIELHLCKNSDVHKCVGLFLGLLWVPWSVFLSWHQFCTILWCQIATI
jgi:hypothetical protein